MSGPLSSTVDRAQLPDNQYQPQNVGAVAASAVVDGNSLDLGAEHHYTCVVAHKNGVASAGEILSLQYSADNTTWYNAPAYSGNGAASFSTSGVDMHVQGRPMGRYVRAVFTNGATAQTALQLNLAAMVD